MTLPEVMLWRALRGGRLAGLRFRRQQPLGPYVADFFCPRASLVVEVDGESHGLADQRTHDDQRDRWMRAQGLIVLRLPATMVLTDVDAVARVILATAAPPPGAAWGRGTASVAGGGGGGADV
ncbi:MAG: endonuclease domain-containing protein [Caulobacter sp.]|nr:endonuclease domain-containing protein [Caulobacter sp.]